MALAALLTSPGLLERHLMRRRDFVQIEKRHGLVAGIVVGTDRDRLLRQIQSTSMPIDLQDRRQSLFSIKNRRTSCPA
jgi:hypothetical protein